jgi:lysine 2,3-aminomutase
MIPRAGEMVVSEGEMLKIPWARMDVSRCGAGPAGAPDRVLFLVTDRCAGLLSRYCTRSRLVSNAQGYNFHPEFEQGLRYIEAHPEIRDVLLSGGDPLLLSDRKLEHLLARLPAIPRVEFIRIGTRIPVFLPQRITPELCEIFRGYAAGLDERPCRPSPRSAPRSSGRPAERLAFAGVAVG